MEEAGPWDPAAVIDIGSNSGRVVVYQRDGAGMLRILSTTRAALRLVSDVDTAHVLGPEAVERALEALRDFNAVARGAGARRIFAVATAAIRDAANGPDLIERVRREIGIAIEIIDGEREALYGLRGGPRRTSYSPAVISPAAPGSPAREPR